MVDVAAPLNARQMEVLRWIADGCPDGVMVGSTFKTTAVALQGRRLVEVSRRRGEWRATVTDAGRFYIENGRHPAHSAAQARTPPAGPAPRVRRRPVVKTPAPSRSSAADDDLAARPSHDPGSVGGTTPPRPEPGAVTAELVLERVRAAGGDLTVTDLSDQELTAWRRAAKVAQLRLSRVGPERIDQWAVGTTLRLRLDLVRADDADDDELSEIEMEELLAATRPPPVLPRTAEFLGRTVPVPSTVSTPHDLVTQLEEAVQRPERLLYASSNLIGPPRTKPLVRMRRIWQAIINEAILRGYRVRVDHDRRDRSDHGSLIITIGRDDCAVSLYGDRTTPLRLSLPSDQPRKRNPDTWTDTPDTKLERRLGEMLTRVEQRADAQIALRAEQDRQNKLARVRWKAAIADARRAFTQEYRQAVIAQRVDDVRYVSHVRAYCRTLRAKAMTVEGPQRESVLAWAAWAVAYADEIDPLRAKAGAPATPEPTPEQLRPYLRGQSPYGP